MEATALATKTSEIASHDVGILETPPKSNLGPRIEQYQDYTGIPHGSAYCASACSLWVHEAAAELGVAPQFKTAGSALHLWSNNPDLQIAPADLTPDMLPVVGINIDDDKIHGHAFLVVGMDDTGKLQTVDPNSDPQGSREGTGVWALDRRTTSDSNRVGYVRIA
jgi:hypothetical protein